MNLQLIRNLIAKGKLEEAANTLTDYFDKEMSRENKEQFQLYNQAINQLSRLSDLKRAELSGILKYEDAELERNKIRAGLLGVIGELERNERIKEKPDLKDAIPPKKTNQFPPYNRRKIILGILACIVLIIFSWLTYNWIVGRDDNTTHQQLIIDFPSDNATIEELRPTFKWDRINGASHYFVTLTELEPTNHPIDERVKTTQNDFQSASTLIAGNRYELTVYAYRKNQTLAINTVRFNIKAESKLEETPTHTRTDLITGQLKHRNQAVANIPVVLIEGKSCDPNRKIKQVTTDSKGSYTFEDITSGDYRIAINGWNKTATGVKNYETTCTWPLIKKEDKALTLNWSLHKTDLTILHPENQAKLPAIASIPFRWEAYPNANRYKVILYQTRPKKSEAIWEEFTFQKGFRSPTALKAGYSYKLLVWAYDETGQIAVGVRFFEKK